MAQPFPPAAPAFGTVASAAPERPATLRFAFLGALLAGLLGAAGSAILIAQARDVAARATSDVLGTDVGDLGGDLAGVVVGEAAGTLVTRGISGLVSAALIVAMAFAVRNGATWARVVLTVLLVGALCANGVAVADIAPAATKALDVAAMLAGVVVVVLLFLPASNRYAKARKQRVG